MHYLKTAHKKAGCHKGVKHIEIYDPEGNCVAYSDTLRTNLELLQFSMSNVSATTYTVKITNKSYDPNQAGAQYVSVAWY